MTTPRRRPPELSVEVRTSSEPVDLVLWARLYIGLILTAERPAAAEDPLSRAS
jgi:hypothetical protein